MKIRARVALFLAILAASWIGAGLLSASGSSERVPMTTREKALHVLNRLGFGPRPADLDRVMELGVIAYIDAQLRPERIPDPAVVEKLRNLPTLEMTTAQLFDSFERPIREARRESKREASKKDAEQKRDAAEAAETDLQKYREMIPPEKRPRRIIEELSAARILRAVYSERQLNEVMTDFWMNHFNVYAAKGLDRVFITSFERDVIRPRIWGKFEDLLIATAKSPAMLFYLDNARSVADEAHRPAAPAQRAGPFGRGRLRDLDPEMVAKVKADAPKGINENYARELMELHTLGVDGGYTQKDVTELARVLTGWSIDPQQDGAGFVFRARLHDVGSKRALGHSFPAGGGIEEGERMIHILAHHPSTAHHIAWELSQRLVADDPPKQLVDRVAKKFLAADGDLRETIRAIVTSPEFFEPQYYRAKVKSPFEYVVSAIRAVNASTDGRMPVAREIAQMGEPLYLCQPPTGYSDAASAWVNTGAIVARLNFALALAANKLPGTESNLTRLLQPDDLLDSRRSFDGLARVFVGGDLSADTRSAIEKRIEDRQAPLDDPEAKTQLPMIAGLILGSPEFQRQ